MVSSSQVPAAAPRTAQLLSFIILLLTAAAAAGGLFLPSLYRDSAWLVTAMRGQDLYTLAVAVPALAITLLFARRGSVRSRLVLVGLLGYILYTYTGAAFAFAFNEFFLLYVTLFSLSLAALFALVGRMELADLPNRFGPATPRRAVAIFLIVIGLMLAMAELGQIIPFLTEGRLPLPLQLAEAPTFYPYTLDLGVVMPLCLLTGVWLWRREPRGYLLAGVMLIKAATMGLALLATSAYAWLTGGIVDGPDLLVGYGIIGFGGLAMSVWFFRHCRG
ncbi:MAG: hypothetical protein ACOY93_20480 [Bacillota bacterium]